jgi:23S rRNA (uridine2552-2'-O)-methyltransferase
VNKNIKISKLNNLKKPISAQSHEWVKRHLNDQFVKQAKKDGYISRAAYKLLEIQEKFKLIKNNHNIIELGSAPGGWTQVISKILNQGKIFAIDLLDMEFVNQNLHFIKGNFIEEQDQILQLVNDNLKDGGKIHGVLSDMAPSTSGDHEVDHWRIIELCYAGLEFARQTLKTNGYFITKVFIGGEEKEFTNEAKKSFEKIGLFKPKASRKESSEIYLVCSGFKI